MNELPKEARELLASAPSEFVEVRKRLAKQLREDGRSEEASVVAALPKPSPPVFAVNRAVRDRPKAAQSAYECAARLAKAQLKSDPEAFARASKELQDALDLLWEVAVTHIAHPRGRASDQMQRRLRELLRSAAADAEARQALRDGVLMAELEPTGFDAFAGMAATPAKHDRFASRERAITATKRQREQEFRGELSAAIERMEDAEHSLARAQEVHSKAVRDVEAIKRKLKRL
jgi:hypothetical protein